MNIKFFLPSIGLCINGHLNSLSYVTSVTALSPEEIAYSAKRVEYAQAAWEKKITNPIGRVPKIAVCISGGGLRAMIGGLGFLQAFSQDGLLDLTSYLCGLSGSTWAISGWLQSHKALSDYITFLKPGLNAGLLGNVDVDSIIKELFKKFENGQSISLDDIWGSLIAQKVLDYPAMHDLTQIRIDTYCPMPADSSLPLPIYNCVTPLDSMTDTCYRWVEWTPFDVRCPFLKTAIPVSYLGSTFNKGSVTLATEPLSLSLCQGIWGSVISADIQDVIGALISNASGYEQIILDMIQQSLQTDVVLNDLTSVRALPAQLPNWNYKIVDAVLPEKESLTFVDCGMLCNLPLPPALDPLRKIDIIIVVDLTMETDTASQLECMQAYALANGLPFPHINTKILNNVCSVHPGDPGSGTPTIIYFPLVSNQNYQNGWDPLTAGFTNTFNIQYTPQQVDQMSGLMYAACAQNSDTIWSVIKSYMSIPSLTVN